MEQSLIVGDGWDGAVLPDASASLRQSSQLAYAKFPRSASTNADAYQVVTARILDKMASGVVPWHRPWTQGAPKNFNTGNNYRGVNFFLLGCTEFSSRYWLTYKQAQEQGGFVKRGSEGEKVIYWHWRNEDEIEKLVLSGKAEKPAPCISFMATVFNLEQTEGIAAPDDDIRTFPTPPLEVAEKVIAEMPQRPALNFVTSAIARAFYRPGRDDVTLPTRERFEQPEKYYATLFHELVHSTGHASRLARNEGASWGKFGSESYSFEELIAELGASYLCSYCGIENTVLDNSASYLSGWLDVFKQDKKIFMTAASAAQKAADFILGRTQDTPETAAPDSLPSS